MLGLPDDDFERLRPALEDIALPMKARLFPKGQASPYVYFPVSGVISLVTPLDDGRAVEAAIVGWEGMAGVHAYLAGSNAWHDAIVQVPGRAMRMRAELFREELTRECALRDMLNRQMHRLLGQVTQTGACHQVHTLRQRACRWLLGIHDRMDGDDFPLTQEFLAVMLGVRRQGVNEVARQLQEAGYIDYHRGQVTVRDRTGLERAVCECYRIENEMDAPRAET